MKSDEHGAFVLALEGRRGNGQGPLSGLTFAVKDNIDVRGTPTGNGSPSYARWRGIPEEDATVLVVLENAGATCIGKTHMHELAYGLTGINNALGTPRNPFRPNRISGGSSSGSAVAVAAGLVDFAVGTDTGGSVRVPAAFCGIYGFRPTHGAIPLDGVVSLGNSFDTVGIFARTAEMLERVMDQLLPPEDMGTTSRPGNAIVFDDVERFADQASINRVNEIGEALKGLGYTLQKTNGADYLASARAAQTVLQGAEAYAFHRKWLESDAPMPAPDVSSLLHTGGARTDDEIRSANAVRLEVTDYASSLIASNDVLLLPVGPGDPPTSGDLNDPEFAMMFRTSILNLSNFASLIGFPVISVPTPGPSGEGLGVQLIGRAGTDRKLLRVASSLERQETRYS